MRDLLKKIEETINSGAKSVLVSSIDERFPGKILIDETGIVAAAGKLTLSETACAELQAMNKTDQTVADGIEVLCEVLRAEPKLVICGAGHVAEACIKIARVIGLRTVVIEDRVEFADIAKASGADEVLVGDYQDLLRTLESDSDTYFLSMTRAHAIDQNCMEVILTKESAYVGMLGGPKKINALRTNLAEKGIPVEVFDQVHTPVGLSINAKTPGEIAVSVMAEIIQIKNDKPSEQTFSHEILEAIAQSDEPGIMVTLVDNGGGSPRAKGTKMIIFPGEKRIGTIGGGLLEGSAAKRATKMLERGVSSWRLQEIGLDDTGSAMACCGRATLLMERID